MYLVFLNSCVSLFTYQLFYLTYIHNKETDTYSIYNETKEEINSHGVDSDCCFHKDLADSGRASSR